MVTLIGLIALQGLFYKSFDYSTIRRNWLGKHVTSIRIDTFIYTKFSLNLKPLNIELVLLSYVIFPHGYLTEYSFIFLRGKHV